MGARNQEQGARMKTQMTTLTLAVLGGLGAMAMPSVSHAGVVGEYINPSCGSTENLSIPVAAAGHSWVAVNTLDAASLQGLNALILRACGGYSSNAAVNTAVQGGMALVLDASGVTAGSLPGNPAFTFTGIGGCEVNYSLAPGAPITTGPGGTLTDDSLDVGGPGGTGGWCSFTQTTPVATLPTGATPFFTTVDGQNAGAVGYAYGNGQVALSLSQLSHQVVYMPSEYVYAGAKTYFINTLTWSLAGSHQTTCASSGYKGTQLLWCQKICEGGLSGKALDDWIQRWIRQFRQLPYCALPGGGGGGGNPT